MPAAAPQTPTEANPFVPGVSYYLVLEPSAVIAPNGVRQLAQHGPFVDFKTAAGYASTRPGSLITVTLILDQIPVSVVAAAPAFQPMKRP